MYVSHIRIMGMLQKTWIPNSELFAHLYICLKGRVFTNGPGDQGSISGRVIPKTQKMELDASLLNYQHYKVRIKGYNETIQGME